MEANYFQNRILPSNVLFIVTKYRNKIKASIILIWRLGLTGSDGSVSVVSTGELIK